MRVRDCQACLTRAAEAWGAPLPPSPGSPIFPPPAFPACPPRAHTHPPTHLCPSSQSGLSGLGGLLGVQGAAHRPSPRLCPLPHPGARGQELRAGRGGAAGTGAAGLRALTPAASPTQGVRGASPSRPATGVRVLEAGMSPCGRAPPSASAELAPRAPPAAARLGRAGAPRPVGFFSPSSSVSPPPPGSLGGLLLPPTTLPLNSLKTHFPGTDAGARVWASLCAAPGSLAAKAKWDLGAGSSPIPPQGCRSGWRS